MNDMEDIISLAESIGDKLQATDLYKNYILSKNNIQKDEELSLRIYRYKKMNFDYQYKIINNIQPSFDEERKMSTVYWELVLNKDAKMFLESEEKLVELMDNIFNVIGKSCEIELLM